MVVMVIREGLHFDETELRRFDALLQVLRRNQQGLEIERFQKGELILTQKGIVFLRFEGIFQNKKVRHHSFDYDIIKGVRIESRGITGVLSNQEFLVIEIESSSRPLTLKYSCSKAICTSLYKSLEERLVFKSSKDKFQKELLKLLRPVAEADLKQISEQGQIRNMLSVVLGRRFATPQNYLNAVMDMTRSLISDGLLDGIIDDSGKYISRISLERKSVQYQVSIDFASLFTQLKGKGILLESLECPSCKGQLEYPESGSVVICKYCGSNVSAIDVFEKFRTFLDI